MEDRVKAVEQEIVLKGVPEPAIPTGTGAGAGAGDGSSPSPMVAGHSDRSRSLLRRLPSSQKDLEGVESIFQGLGACWVITANQG